VSAREKVRVAVVGAGYWGKNLVRNFAAVDSAQLVMVCDADPKVRARIGAEYAGVAVAPDLADALGRSDVDAVVLATPASTHAACALAALQAGKDVFVEKPLALSVADASAVVAEAATRGRVLMVGHLLAYHPAFARVVEIVRSGEIGEVFYVYSQRVNLGKVRTDENALWSLGPHDFSMIFALVDGPLASVAARGHAYLRPGTEDVVFVNASFRSGAMANVQLSWLDPHKERRLTVVGSRKMIVFDDAHPTEKIRIHDKGFDRPPEYHSYDAFLSLRDGDIVIPRVSLEEPLRIECRHFVECVAARRAPRTGGPEGLRVVEALAAADASLRRGGAPIVL
jgi:predicted dehydrogenase